MGPGNNLRLPEQALCAVGALTQRAGRTGYSHTVSASVLRDILDRPFLAGTEWSAVIIPPSGRRQEWRANRLLSTASVAKLFLLVEVAARLESGTIAAGAGLSRAPALRVGDSGLWQHLATDVLPVEDVALLVGAVSDNWATNVLLDLVGLDVVQQRAQTLAPNGSTLLDFVRTDRTQIHADTLSIGCASDWAALMQSLSRGTIISESVSKRVSDWIAPALDLSMVANALSLDPLAHVSSDADYSIWCKTGTDDGVRADVGSVLGPRGTLVYAVICNWDVESADRRDDVLVAMRSVGALVRSLVS